MPGAVFLLFVLGLFINPLLKLIQSRAAKIRTVEQRLAQICTDQFRLRQHSCRQIGSCIKTPRNEAPSQCAPRARTRRKSALSNRAPRKSAPTNSAANKRARRRSQPGHERVESGKDAVCVSRTAQWVIIDTIKQKILYIRLVQLITPGDSWDLPSAEAVEE